MKRFLADPAFWVQNAEGGDYRLGDRARPRFWRCNIALPPGQAGTQGRCHTWWGRVLQIRWGRLQWRRPRHRQAFGQAAGLQRRRVPGSGQRQNSSEEMYESLKRQNNLSPKHYEWYIDLRKLPGYKTTSGFGLGIERFIAWALAKENIRDVIPYPRLKNIKMFP